MIWEKTNWTNPTIIYLFNDTIFEYDIKSAGTSISEYYKLLPKETLDTLKNAKKEKRVVMEGNLQRDNKEYRDRLNEGFKNIRKLFIESNGLTEDDIISIKKDAIFVTRKVRFTKFDCVHFVKKNQYSSYINTHGKEYYYSKDVLDIKGISDEAAELHKEGMLRFIIEYFYKAENKDKKTLLKYISDTFTKYKMLELPVEYYREFDFNSSYNVTTDDSEWKEWWDDRKDELDIMYNIENIFIPFTKIAM